ncbi:MAG: DUF5615 family PIN-like protein [Acidobacteriota bacterium]
MKVLLDSCVWGGAKQTLVEAGHDVVWSGDWDSDPGDTEILSVAHREGRVLVTLDKDFGELAVLHGAPHHGIVRLVNLAARQQGPAAVEVLRLHGDSLATGALVTVDQDRLRIRSASH